MDNLVRHSIRNYDLLDSFTVQPHLRKAIQEQIEQNQQLRSAIIHNQLDLEWVQFKRKLLHQEPAPDGKYFKQLDVETALALFTRAARELTGASGADYSGQNSTVLLNKLANFYLKYLQSRVHKIPADLDLVELQGIIKQAVNQVVHSLCDLEIHPSLLYLYYKT